MRWDIRLIAEYSACAAAFWAASLTPWLWLPAALLLGTRQHALGIIGHWAMHGLLPRWIMWACYTPIAIDPRVYGKSHALHHQHLGGALDPETHVVEQYAERWGRLRPGVIALDVVGLHLDEAMDIMRLLTSARAIALYVGFVAVLYAIIGPLALLWPAGTGGLLVAHRVRARFEHDHLMQPGITFRHEKPALWLRLLFLPHFAWLHYEHHAAPGDRVWSARG
jgi:fatty acid desaturase